MVGTDVLSNAVICVSSEQHMHETRHSQQHSQFSLDKTTGSSTPAYYIYIYLCLQMTPPTIVYPEQFLSRPSAVLFSWANDEAFFLHITLRITTATQRRYWDNCCSHLSTTHRSLTSQASTSINGSY